MGRGLRWAMVACALWMSGCGAEDEGQAQGTAQDAMAADTREGAGDTQGADAQESADNANSADSASSADSADASGIGGGLCPPAGASGAEVGEVAPPLTWVDCDGNTYDLRALCERDAVWVVLFAGWCPSCRGFAGQVNDFTRPFVEASQDGFAPFFLITEDAQYGAPDAAYCAAVRAQYGLTVPVLYEPTGATQQALGVRNNHVHLVFGRGNVIAFKGQYSAPDDVAAAIDALLTR